MKRRDAIREFEGLIDWYRPMVAVDPRTQISLVWDKDSDSYAAVTQSARRRIAQMEIGPKYGTQSWRDRCQTAIHELLHVAQHGMHTLVHEAAESGVLGECDQFILHYSQQHELFTDTLAETLVDLLPMPVEGSL